MSNSDRPVGKLRRPRMIDIAELCGVSVKSVSRVVNGQPGTSPETTQRILDAIDKLGFRRNQLASDLRHIGPSSIVGVVIEDVSNPFYGSMIRAIEESAKEHGLMVVTVSSDEDPEREHELVRELISRQVAGLIIVTATADNAYLQPDIDRGLAVVFADRPGGGVECDEVLLDDANGSADAVRHLLRQGHTRIGVIADFQHVYTADARVQGYRAALESYQIEVDPALIRFGQHSASDAAEAVHALLALAEPPTALFTTNNRATSGALRAMYSRDSQLALVGFDDFEFADLLIPSVSVVSHDPMSLGNLATERLYARIAGDSSARVRHVLPSRLVVRESSVRRAALPVSPQRG
jgi:LacI family transcriptional regulator